MMACSKGLGLPRRMLLVMFLFMSLLVQHAQGVSMDFSGKSCVAADEAKDAAGGCASADSKMKCDPTALTCGCATKGEKADAKTFICGAATAAGTPTTTAGSKVADSAGSAAVRTFIPSIIALAGLFLGVGVLSTF